MTAPKKINALNWARRCRIEAARATHPSTRALLLDLAGEYEAILGKAVIIDPDDIELQDACADCLMALAARRKTSLLR